MACNYSTGLRTIEYDFKDSGIRYGQSIINLSANLEGTTFGDINDIMLCIQTKQESESFEAEFINNNHFKMK